MKTVFNILAVLIFAGGVGSTIAFRIFWSRLRKLHTATWEALGKPEGFEVPSVRFLKFLWRQEYESLPDDKTKALGQFLRLLLILSVLLLALSVVWSIEIHARVASGMPQF